MIAVRIGPDIRMTIVVAPSCLEKHPAPKTVQDSMRHNCINLRLPTYGGLLGWELRRGRRELRVRVEGQVTFNGTCHISLQRWMASRSVAHGHTYRDLTDSGRMLPRSTLRASLVPEGSSRSAARGKQSGNAVNRIIYIVGLVVIVIAVLSFFGLR